MTQNCVASVTNEHGEKAQHGTYIIQFLGVVFNYLNNEIWPRKDEIKLLFSETDYISIHT